MRSALVIALVLAGLLQAQQATVREEQQAIKTYPFSGPDPSPILIRAGRGQRLYPYFSFDNLSYTGANRDWTVVRLENPYLTAFVLPGEGGKLMGAVEKSTGKEFIYYNHVRKFRHIALRGPWTAGGIELNFGLVGHTPATATPVDYVFRKNPDGSVSCTVGAMDLPSRTEWRVTFTVFPDKAYIELRSLWYNPQPLNQSYYVWMNAANKLTPDLEFILPGTAYIGHNYAVPSQPWPIGRDGRNLALYRNHRDSDDGSFFIHGMLEDFSGGYWHDARFGYGHWALHEEVPGQKFFRWGLSRAGAIWESLLTDSDGPYFEPQNGRLLDQNDHEFFAPYSTDQWRELYFPYKEIGGMVKATPYGALNVTNNGAGLELGFCALRNIDETLVVRAAGKEIFRDRVVLKPMEVYRKMVPAAVARGELRVDVGSRLSYTDDPAAAVLERPLHFRNYDESTAEGLYQSAERDEKGRNYGAALRKYLSLLEREPLQVRTLARVAELYCRRAEYGRALEYARKALDYSMYDADANYIYGIVARRLDKLADAKETLGWAARSMKYRAAALGELGSIYLAEGNLERSTEYLERALKYDADNIRTRQLLATNYRLLKQPEKARQVLDRILEIDPLSHFARFERYLIDRAPAALTNFKAMIRNELPHETYLELAVYYANLRLNADALKALEAAPDQATVRYWQAWLRRDPLALEKASALSPYLVFPFRQESIPVFQWAIEARPGDWKPKYYLALVYWGLGRNEDALKLLEECGSQPDYAPAYISRAALEGPSPRTQADYERAREVGKSDWRNWYHLADYYSQNGLHDQALTVASEAARAFPGQDAIKIQLARGYLSSGRYQDCYAVLEKATILPYEGQRDVHSLFVRCQLCRALEEIKAGRFAEALKFVEGSREYPERLGTGAPARPNYAIQDALAALCRQKMGQPAEVPAGVEEWYRTALRLRSEPRALEVLSGLIGSSPRR